MPSTRSKVPGSEIGDEDTPRSRWGRLIESGTGLSIPRAEPSDPLTDFEARQSSWCAAAPYIEKLEIIKEPDTKESIDRELLRFAVLRLADLALIAYRGEKRTPVRLATIARRLNSPTASPNEEFSLLHYRKASEQGTRVNGRPSYAEVLSVLSGLAWHFKYQTTRAHHTLLVHLLRCVYPPIFMLRRQRHQRHAWRQLSDDISKYRRKKDGEDGETDFQQLNSAMAHALQAPDLPSSK